MGERSSRAGAVQAQTLATSQIAADKQRRTQTEAQRAELQSYLGSEEQFSGGPTTSQDVLPYTSRYQLDDTTFQQAVSWLHPRERRTGVAGLRTIAEQAAAQANQFMDQAEQAARAGDLTAAAEFREQAQQAIQNMGTEQFGNRTSAYIGEKLRSTVQETGPSAQAQARALAAGEQGMMVGEMVRRGRALLDRNSAESRQTFEDMTRDSLDALEHGRINAERGVAANYRAQERAARDVGAMRGAGRSSETQVAMQQRAADAAALATAEIRTATSEKKSEFLGQAHRVFEDFRNAYAKDSITFANDWINNAGGIRDSFHGAIDQLSLIQAGYQDQMGEKLWEQADAHKQKSENRRAMWTQVAITGAGMALGGAVGGLTGGLAAVVPGMSAGSGLGGGKQ